MKALATCLLVLAAAPVAAQGLEVTAIAGYTSKGGIQQEAVGISDVQLEGGFTWGVGAGYFFSSRLGVEGSWVRQQSGLEVGTTTGEEELFPADVDRFRGAFVYQFGDADSPLRPYLAAGAGAARFSAPSHESQTKLVLGVGGGIRWLPKGRLGGKLEALYTPTYLHDAGSSTCDAFGFCQSWLHQLELTGGLVVRF